VLVFAGVIWTAVLLIVDREFLLWMLPIITGLLLSPFLFRLASSYTLGQAARKRNLFLVPEEHTQPAIISATAANLSWLEAVPVSEENDPAPLPPEGKLSMPISPVFQS
jgi:membrane glycosyltransferase